MHSPVLARRKTLYRITISAIFLSLTLVVSTLTTAYLPVLGAAGIKISISGIISVFPALLFGPAYGAAVCALVDILGHFISPAGAYIPLLTLTAALSGFLIGLFWKWLERFRAENAESFNRVAAIFMALLALLGAAFILSLRADGLCDTLWVRAESVPEKAALTAGSYRPLTALAVSLIRYTSEKKAQAYFAAYANFLGIGLIAFGVIGLLLLVLMRAASVRHPSEKQTEIGFGSLFFAVFVPRWIVTTINTKILQVFLTAWNGRAFWILYAPRLLEEILTNIFQVYLIWVLYNVYRRRIEPSLRGKI